MSTCNKNIENVFMCKTNQNKIPLYQEIIF